MNQSSSLRFLVFALLPVLPGCGALTTSAGRVGLLVLLPMLFIALFLLALWYQRRTPQGREDADERRYPDYRGDRDRG